MRFNVSVLIPLTIAVEIPDEVISGKEGDEAQEAVREYVKENLSDIKTALDNGEIDITYYTDGWSVAEIGDPTLSYIDSESEAFELIDSGDDEEGEEAEEAE